MGATTGVFEGIVGALAAACREVYGDRLVSLVVFGSVGRRVMRPDSDIDLLLIASSLPAGRLRRVAELEQVERRLEAALATARAAGVHTELSPILKTVEEAEAGSPLFLDMVDDAWIVHDREGFFGGLMERLRRRLDELGARRIWRGTAWYWDLKPDYQPGEVFEL